ncbi:hypothetical protein [Altericista sp. CCNU0014]|uniref:hypothetical protein n=1 Tax=Altericista sp. CCNU0014 TaxID=3082949 RepID=UPI00384C77E5
MEHLFKYLLEWTSFRLGHPRRTELMQFDAIANLYLGASAGADTVEGKLDPDPTLL